MKKINKLEPVTVFQCDTDNSQHPTEEAAAKHLAALYRKRVEEMSAKLVDFNRSQRFARVMRATPPGHQRAAHAKLYEEFLFEHMPYLGSMDKNRLEAKGIQEALDLIKAEQIAKKEADAIRLEAERKASEADLRGFVAVHGQTGPDFLLVRPRKDAASYVANYSMKGGRGIGRVPTVGEIMKQPGILNKDQFVAYKLGQLSATKVPGAATDEPQVDF